MLACAPSDPASAARTARRQGAAERGPPATEAEESRFRRCPLPRWRRRGLSCAGRNLGGVVGAGGRDAASGAGPRVDAGGVCAAPGARFEAAVGARSSSDCRQEKASLRLGLAARELRAGAPGDALPARLHLQGGSRGPGPRPQTGPHPARTARPAEVSARERDRAGGGAVLGGGARSGRRWSHPRGRGHPEGRGLLRGEPSRGAGPSAKGAPGFAEGRGYPWGRGFPGAGPIQDWSHR